MGDDIRAQYARTLEREKRIAMIANGADLAAAQWYKETVRDMQTRFLFWRPAKPGEAMTLPIIATTAPNEEWTQDVTISIALTVAQVRALVIQRWNALPILGKPNA